MKTTYQIILAILGISFALFFFITIGPPFLKNPDLIEACKAGYVNVYSSGFATDAVMCWMVLAAWVIYERFEKGIKHGWLPLLLGIVPGVATGLAVYLLLRLRQKPD